MWREFLNIKQDMDILVQNQFSYEEKNINVITTGSICCPDCRSYYAE
jgi:hypothetical protein